MEYSRGIATDPSAFVARPDEARQNTRHQQKRSSVSISYHPHTSLFATISLLLAALLVSVVQIANAASITFSYTGSVQYYTIMHGTAYLDFVVTG